MIFVIYRLYKNVFNRVSCQCVTGITHTSINPEILPWTSCVSDNTQYLTTPNTLSLGGGGGGGWGHYISFETGVQ